MATIWHLWWEMLCLNSKCGLCETRQVLMLFFTPPNVYIHAVYLLSEFILFPPSLQELKKNSTTGLTQSDMKNRVRNFQGITVKIWHDSFGLTKISKLSRNFEVSSNYSRNIHPWPSRYEYANEWGDDVIASQFSIHFVHRSDKNFICR